MRLGFAWGDGGAGSPYSSAGHTALRSPASFPDTQPFRWRRALPRSKKGNRVPSGPAAAGKSALAPRGAQRALSCPGAAAGPR